MATYTRNNETINGAGGEMDYHQGTAAADSVLATNITVVSGDSVAVPDYWEPYTVNGGVFIYDGKDGNDTMNAKNLKIEGGLFQYIGGDDNDKFSVNGANVSGGSLKVNGAWDNDSLNVSNVTISGGYVSIYGDTGTDTVSVSKVSVTGGSFKQRDHGRSNINTASEVTIQGGHFEVSTGILERVGDDPLDADSVVESIGGSNTLSASKVSMTSGTLAVYSEGANNSVKVSDVTMSGGSASIYGGKTANVNGGKGTDTISVSKVSMGSYYASLSVFNGGSNNSISVEDVTISSGYVSIYGEGGNNTITANKLLTEMYSHLDIHAQEKANSIAITNSTFAGGYGASIYGEGGNDTFSFTNNTVTGDEIKIWGGSSADNFTVEDVTISGGKVSINGNGGDDNFTVDNVSMTGGNIYVIGGEGNANVSVSNIDKTAGYFDIDMGGSDSAASGNDTIYVENISNADRAYFDIYARDGADSISIKNSDSVSGYLRAYGGAGKDTITAENISMNSSYGYFSIVGGADDDLISVKSSNNVWAYGDEGNDTIYLEDFSGGFYAGAGNDSVSVTKMIEGNRGHFYGGAGNDTIEFFDTWMSYYNSYSGGGDVDGDEGDDLITARNATIYGTGFFGGEGNDTISVDNSTVTSGFRFYNGAGNDSISVSNITGNFSGDVLFYSEYSTYASDGNDTISLDNWTLTGDDSQRILINGGTYGVDNSSINGADSISIKNIIAPNATFYVYGKGGNDTVSFENMTLGGLGTSYGSTNVRSGYIYGNFDSGNDSISFKNIEFYKGSSGKVSLNGGEGADTISVDGVTLGDENDSKWTQSHLSIAGGADADVINVVNVTVTGSYSSANIYGEDGADKISVTDSSGLQITGGDGNDTIYFGGAVNATLNDLASGDVISLSGDYSQAYYKSDKNIFIYGTGVKVSLSGVDDVADISSVTIYNGGTRTNVGNFVTVLEWKLENGVASYGDLINIGGLSSLATFEDITVDGKAINTLDDEEILATGADIVISANALDTSTTVSITSGYTLALADGVTTPEDIPEHWEISEGNAAYFATGSTGGYVLSNNEIYYQSEVTGSVMVEITGLSNSATEENLSLNKKVVTISANALDENNTVEISSGYTLALDTDVTISETTSAGWNISSGTASYNTENITEGYTVSDNQISYVAEIVSETLVTVSGLKSSATAKNLSIDTETKIVTVAQAATTKGNLSISDSYALELEKGTYSGVSVIGSADADSIIQNGGSALISVGAGNDYISLGASTSKNTIIGGAGNDSIYSSKGSNLYQYATGEGNDFISGITANDTLQFTSGEIESWSVEDSDLTFKISEGSIKIANGVGASITVLESGSKKAETFIYGENLKYDAKKTAVTLTADYEGTYTASTTSIISIDGAAADSIAITGNAKNNLIIGGENSTLYGGKGNDTLTGGDGADVYIFNAGKDVITNYAEGDKISIGGAIKNVSVKSADVIFTVGSNTLTVKNGVSKQITTIDTLGAESTFIYETGKIYNADKTAVTLTAAYKGTVESGVVSVDGSAVASALNITGNDLNNVIYGGTKADSLNGGAGDDTLTGGVGNDTFFSSAGNDVITDYTAKQDKIKFSGDFSWSISGADVVFTTDEGSITVTDGAGKEITTLDNKNKAATQIYSASNARTLDLLYDNNFLTDDTSLDSITENKFAVTNIETTNTETFAQEENILTFAKDK